MMKRIASFLNEQSSFTRQLVNGVSDMLYVLDLQANKLEFLNPWATELLYHKSVESGQEDVAIFEDELHPDDRPKRMEHLAACRRLEDNEAKEIDVRLRVKDGGYRWFHIRDLVFSRSQEGVATHLTGIIRPVGSVLLPDDMSPDIPDVKDLSRFFRWKNKEVQDLHSELQGLTTVITQEYLETLRQIYISLEMVISVDAHLFSNPSKAHLRRAQSMLQRLNLLTNDIATYAAIHTPDSGPEPVNLNRIIDGVLSELGGKVRAANAVIDRQPLPEIPGYPLLLPVLFNHLLLNALKFKLAERAPVIRIYCERVEGKDIPGPGVFSGRSYHKVVIRDNGIGFDPEEKGKIFSIFYQGHNKLIYKGSGTGLAIARKIMTIHGGVITADGIPGKGAEFCCYFFRLFLMLERMIRTTFSFSTSPGSLTAASNCRATSASRAPIRKRKFHSCSTRRRNTLLIFGLIHWAVMLRWRLVKKSASQPPKRGASDEKRAVTIFCVDRYTIASSFGDSLRPMLVRERLMPAVATPLPM
jgi:signal transduction histidine kinase